MGYNTTILVLNDALSFIEDDPEFGKRLAQAIMEAASNGGKPVNVPSRSSRGGIHCNAATVIESHHASHSVLIEVGQNYGRVVPREEVTIKRKAPLHRMQAIDDQIGEKP